MLSIECMIRLYSWLIYCTMNYYDIMTNDRHHTAYSHTIDLTYHELTRWYVL